MSAHLSKDERDRLAHYRFRNYSQVEIAKLLNRSPSTISRELKRNAAGRDYYACPVGVAPPASDCEAYPGSPTAYCCGKPSGGKSNRGS